MSINAEALFEQDGYKMADRIDIFESGRSISLIPGCMNDELAGWRCYLNQQGCNEIEVVGDCLSDNDSEDYAIRRIAAKIEGESLNIIVEWLANDRISIITTTAPFTIFWSSGTIHSIFGNLKK